MKKLIFGFCLLVLVSCKNEPQDYSLEEDFYNCVKGNLSEKGIDTDDILNRVEDFLLEKKLLETVDKEGYFAFITRLKKTENYDIHFPEKLENEVVSITGYSIDNCLAIMEDTKRIEKSRTTTILNFMMKNLDQARTKDGWTVKNYSRKLLLAYEKEDFSQPFFRFHFINFLIIEKQKIETEKRRATKKLRDKKKYDPRFSKAKSRNIRYLMLEEKNQILFGMEDVEFSNLKKEVKEFILNPKKLMYLPESPDKAVISIKHVKETKYDFYLQIVKEIEEVYSELRNEKAKEMFEKNFKDISEKQQAEIETIYPIVISELLPIDFDH